VPVGLFAASYAGDATGGVTLFAVHPVTGALEPRWEHSEPVGIRALARHPSRPVIYALGGADPGTVVAISVAGARAETMARTSSGGTLPCSAAVDPSGRYLLAVNYGSGELVVFALEADGTVGPAATVVRQQGSGPEAERQEDSHPHHVVFAPDGRRVVVVDLGADAFFVYELDGETGDLRLVPAGRFSAHPGSGPRQLVFVDDDLVAVADELSDSLSVYEFSPRIGAFALKAVASASAAGRAGIRNYPADVAVTRGRRVLMTNRGNDTISVFDLTGHEPTLVAEAQVGAWPQHLVVVGDGVYCAAQEGDEIAHLQLEDGGARLGPARTVAEASAPSWLLKATLAETGRRR
jgi:6-phosphogluconolactonase (cycloisomerase 2 family)